MQYINLNNRKVTLTANEEEFNLLLPEAKITITGKFDEDFVKVYHKTYISEKVLEAWRIQCPWQQDSYSEDQESLVSTFTLPSGKNWFDLDHTEFNREYLSD